MATTYKILGQVTSPVPFPVDLYTVPSGTQTIVSTINVASITGTDTSFSIYICQNGASPSTNNTLVGGATLAANSVFSATQGITLGPNDKIVVECSDSMAACFQAFGSEIA